MPASPAMSEVMPPECLIFVFIFGHCWIFLRPWLFFLTTVEHVNMVGHATRVVLISIQMLLLAHFKESMYPILFAWNKDYSFNEYPLSEVLRDCHMAKDSEQNQFQLF